MHWRDILTIGLNHHLLYADRSADPEAHCESLLRVLADERLEGKERPGNCPRTAIRVT